MPPEIENYCKLVAEARDRINSVSGVLSGRLSTGDQNTDAQFIFAQFREAAERVNAALQLLTPDSFPVPLLEPTEEMPPLNDYERVAGGFMTKDDFALLYDRTVKRAGDGVIDFGYTVPEWLQRIHKLFEVHSVQLANGDTWRVRVPRIGEAQAWQTIPAG
jgi:hypothetical protein